MFDGFVIEVYISNIYVWDELYCYSIFLIVMCVVFLFVFWWMCYEMMFYVCVVNMMEDLIGCSIVVNISRLSYKVLKMLYLEISLMAPAHARLRQGGQRTR